MVTRAHASLLGPVAQWLEPAAHNGLVAGSSPAGPTSDAPLAAIDRHVLRDAPFLPGSNGLGRRRPARPILAGGLGSSRSLSPGRVRR